MDAIVNAANQVMLGGVGWFNASSENWLFKVETPGIMNAAGTNRKFIVDVQGLTVSSPSATGNAVYEVMTSTPKA